MGVLVVVSFVDALWLDFAFGTPSFSSSSGFFVVKKSRIILPFTRVECGVISVECFLFVTGLIPSDFFSRSEIPAFVLDECRYCSNE